MLNTNGDVVYENTQKTECDGCGDEFNVWSDEFTNFCSKCMGEPTHDDAAECTELMERKHGL